MARAEGEKRIKDALHLLLLDLGSGNDAEVIVAKNGHGAAAPPDQGAAGLPLL
jgi:hypothetical protein